MKTSLKLIALAALLSSGSTMAGNYLIGGIGRGTIDLDVSCPAGVSCNFSGTGGKIIFGSSFDNGLSIESGYIYYGQAKAFVSRPGGSASLSAAGHSVILGAAYTADFSAVQATVRGGIAANLARISGAVHITGGGSGSRSDNETSAQPYVGLGVAYRVTPQTAVGIDLDVTRFRYAGETANTRLVTLAVRHAF